MPKLPAVQRFETASGVRVYRIPCKVTPQLTARVYLVVGAGPVTLVDTGSGHGESTRNILDGLQTVRHKFGETVDPQRIGRILLTHAHLDHCGGLPELLRTSGAEVGVHPSERQVLVDHVAYLAEARRAATQFVQDCGASPDELAGFLDPYRPSQDNWPRVPVDVDLDDGRVLDGLHVLHTPGHSPGHVCLRVDDVLLCGDHILARTVPQQWPERLTPGTGLARYLDSLEKVGRLEGIRVALAGHEPVMENLAVHVATLRRAQTRRNERLVRLFARATAPLSAWDACREIYRKTRGFFLFLSLADTAARIDYLVDRGQLVAEAPDRRGAMPRFRLA